MIEHCPTESLYQEYLGILLCRKKVFIMHSPLVAQNYSKHLPFLLMSKSTCLPITPFYVLSSVPTCALKLPSRTIDSVDVTFCKAAPTSSKKGWYSTMFWRLVHKPAKCKVTAPVA